MVVPCDVVGPSLRIELQELHPAHFRFKLAAPFFFRLHPYIGIPIIELGTAPLVFFKTEVVHKNSRSRTTIGQERHLQGFPIAMASSKEGNGGQDGGPRSGFGYGCWK